MTDDELRVLEELAAKAAKGPWSTEETVEYCGRFARNSLYLIADDRHKAILYNHLAEDKAAAEYIVAACNALPKLIKLYKEADDEAYEANEAWKKLRVEYLTLRYQVQKLEQQRAWLAEKLQQVCKSNKCALGYHCPAGKHGWICGKVKAPDWIHAAEQSAEEAPDEQQ